MRIDVAAAAPEEATKILDEGTHAMTIGKIKVGPAKKDAAKTTMSFTLKSTELENQLCDLVFDTIVIPMTIDSLWPDEQKTKVAQMNKMSRLKLNDLHQAAGIVWDGANIDTDLLEGKVVNVLIKHGVDQNNLPRAEVQRYVF